MNSIIQELTDENIKLKRENEELRLKLEKYNNSRTNYYEKNKEVVNEKAKQRLKRLAKENPEKIKEYARTAYLKQKEKKRLEKQLLENQEQPTNENI